MNPWELPGVYCSFGGAKPKSGVRLAAGTQNVGAAEADAASENMRKQSDF